jgi:hypothetical protein
VGPQTVNLNRCPVTVEAKPCLDGSDPETAVPPSYLETCPTVSCPSPSLRCNPITAGTRGLLFSSRKYLSLPSSCAQLCISSRYVLSFVLLLLCCPVWKDFIMVRIIPLCALAAFSLSPVHGINLDVTSVGESPASLRKPQC